MVIRLTLPATGKLVWQYERSHCRAGIGGMAPIPDDQICCSLLFSLCDTPRVGRCEGDRVALRASAWLSSIVLPSAAGTNAGVIPYCWLGTCYANNDSYGGQNSYLDAAAYVADGIVAMDQRSTDGARATLLRQFRPVVMHLCDTQHGNGSWGVPMGTDQQRSHRLAAIWDVTVAAAQKLGG